MIQLNNITYTYGSRTTALDNVSATIGPGIYLLLGANGAGKTTLMHIMSGLRRPRSGQCLIDGENVAARQPSTLRKVFMLDQAMNWPAPTISRLVKSHAPFYPNFSPELLEYNLKEAQITADTPLASMSLGYHKRADLAYSLALRPQILLLDEPANGLDIIGRDALKRMLVHCVDESQTVIISTHTVVDVESMIDNVMLISAGRITLNQNVEQMLRHIAFTNTPVHNPNAIYEESGLSGFSAIIPNDGTLETAPNYTLLHKAMHNAQSIPLLLNYLNDTEI